MRLLWAACRLLAAENVLWIVFGRSSEPLLLVAHLLWTADKKNHGSFWSVLNYLVLFCNRKSLLHTMVRYAVYFAILIQSQITINLFARPSHDDCHHFSLCAIFMYRHSPRAALSRKRVVVFNFSCCFILLLFSSSKRRNRSEFSFFLSF